MERLQKLIAESGYTSRRKAEELIKEGKVKVNGKIVKELGTKASFGDEILVEGNLIEYEEKEYFLFYKPRSVLSTTKDDKGRKTVLDYFDDVEKRIYPVGRLDYDTTGILLLTNDGEFANLMMHPKNKIDKLYVAKVKGIVTKEEINTLKNGVMLDNKKIYPTRVKLKKLDKNKLTSIVEITVHDGVNHEVKRLMESINHEVIKLKREVYGFLTLDNLKSGEKRVLSKKEVKQLYNIAINKK
ncbi:MAG: rRNA pseudouridine synthase [Bacilli bacterium]|nr:rRNA pseudouridine synthase [Bacilli bacterium]